MASETKIGLLVGVGFVILIGILISDHLSVAQQQQTPLLARDLPELPESVAHTDQGNGRRNRLNQFIQGMLEGQQASRIPGSQQGDAQKLIVWQEPEVSTPIQSRVNGAEPRRVDTGALPGFDPVEMHEPARPVPVAAPVDRVHMLREGERLSDLAKRYYGDANAWQKIYEANQSVISDPNRVRPGIRLVIPDMASSVQAQPVAVVASASASPAPSASGVHTREYRIKENEYLTDVAERFYGSRGAWPKVYALNKDRIADPHRIKPGIVIRVPAR